ncbi:MAG TPA: twin-arginine translocase subunit TatC [Granulicella sp.]|nr:twin-arginine translocase subunit TatC [Granulicella sp.]
MADLIDNVRTAVSDRAELPGMSLMEHLDELRKRLIHSVLYLVLGFIVAYIFHVKLYAFIQAPLDQLHIPLNYTHPTDGLNLYLKTSLYGGAILASPFILYQVWLFISPGLYRHEQRYVVPFMAATVTLFLGGAWFGYRYVLPGALNVLINGFGKQFHPIITIDDYTGFFLAIVLALGATFELPVIIFFLALFGIVDGKFLLKHVRYAILLIFIITAVICPLPDVFSMCLFASPMLVLYFIGVGAAFLVNPSKKKDQAKSA